jgi:septum formation protein
VKRVSQPIWLASRSPRRRQMIADAGLDVRAIPPDIDDAALRPGRVTPDQWVMALAYLKARRAVESLSSPGSPASPSPGTVGTILGADTVCVLPSGEILGQPRHAHDARRMLRDLRDSEHQTITGVCLLPLCGDDRFGTRIMFVDRAAVRIGKLTDRQIEQYVNSGEWRGKAGAYNLSERVEAGWPIQCVGDPATVMGLPMQKLRRDFGL